MLNEINNELFCQKIRQQFVKSTEEIPALKDILYQNIDSQHIVCIDEKYCYNWQDLRANTAAFIQVLEQQYADKEDIALIFKSGFLMLCAVLAALHCQRKMILPPLQTKEHLQDIAEHFDLLLTDNPQLLSQGKATYLGGFNPALKNKAIILTKPNFAIENSAELFLFTSGSTGQPKTIAKYFSLFDRQIKVEYELLKDKVFGSVMYSTVNHNHLLGLMYRLLYPLAIKMPFFDYSLIIPEQLQKIAVPYSLISSPAFLRFLDPNLNYPQANIVFSSGGKLPVTSGQKTQQLLQTEVMEFYGSSETSAIAYRTFPAQNWYLLEGIEFKQAEDECLMISSPFLVEKDWYKLEDRIAIHHNSFELLGRVDRIAKISDKRISLTQIENFILELPQVAEVKALVVTDELRDSVGIVLILNEEFKHITTKEMLAILRKHLHNRIELIALPRKLRMVEFMPMNEQGKMNLQQLGKLFL